MKSKILLCVALMATALGTIVACSDGDLEWTEDVKLPDGRIVTLSRSAELKGGSAAFSNRPSESKQRFEFKHPETGKPVVWSNTKPQGRLTTLALGMDNGKPWLLATPSYGDDFFVYKCPDPPYLLFEYSDGAWGSKPLAAIPVKRIRANMTTGIVDASKYIESGKTKLSADQTGDSYTYYEGVHRIPYVIDFEGMPLQTFLDGNCRLDPSRVTWLLVVEGKK